MIVTFEKGYPLRHIGHLDLMRAMQRALRRSGLPIRFSNGFNPHILLSFASPLSVGVVGLREVMDVPVSGECDPELFGETLGRALPAALPVRAVRAVPDDFPTLMALVSGSKIRILIPAGPVADKVAEAFNRFMSADGCVTLRKTKSGENRTDIRPFVADASIQKSSEGYTLFVTVANRKEGSLKPSVLVQALCELAAVESVPYTAYRDSILSNGKDGTAIPLEEYQNG